MIEVSCIFSNESNGCIITPGMGTCRSQRSHCPHPTSYIWGCMVPIILHSLQPGLYRLPDHPTFYRCLKLSHLPSPKDTTTISYQPPPTLSSPSSSSSSSFSSSTSYTSLSQPGSSPGSCFCSMTSIMQ